MTHDDDVYLGDMLRYGRRIPEYTREGRGRFLADRMVQDAVIRNFEVVGEAASHISRQFRDAHPEIPCREIIGFRNVLIHGYKGLNLERVWTAVERDLPHLLATVDTILRERGIDPERVPE